MAINVKKSAISVGVGVMDEVLEYWDEKTPGASTEPFQTKKDLGRLMLAGIGYGLQAFMPGQAEIGEALALSATPLLVKSVAKPLRKALNIQESISFRARSPVSTIPIPAPAAPAGMQRIG